MQVICELPDYNLPTEAVAKILKRCRKIAVVGISPKESRDSNKVARYLLRAGYDLVPVNPGQREILGRPCFKTLKDIPCQVDIVNVFLNPTRVPPVVDLAIEIGVHAIWMQLGVVHNAAAEKARRAGIQVISNRCIMTEHQRCLPSVGPSTTNNE